MSRIMVITKFLYFMVAFLLLFVTVSFGDNTVTISKGSGTNSTDVVNLAQGRPYSLGTLPSEYYPDSKKLLLTDGKQGKKEDLECGERMCAPGWVGFEDITPVITIDLEQSYQIERISASFLNYPTKGVTAPAAVRLQTSFDGIHWTPRGSLEMGEGSIFDMDKASWGARYVRLIIERNQQYVRLISKLNQWVFLDEIKIFGSGAVAVAPQEPKPLKSVLIVTNNMLDDDERQLRLANLLNGMGIPFDLIDTKQLNSVEFLDYQLLIFASSSKIQLKINQTQQQRIVTAIHSGTNVLWIGAGIWGSFKNTELADAFGVRYIKQNSNEAFGVRFAEYQNLDENIERLPIKHETMWVVQTIDAIAEGWFLDDDAKSLNIPFITRKTEKSGYGTTLYIALSLLDRWKVDETPETYARAEILTKAIRSLLTDGVVGRHPVADAKDAVFMLRLEDYTPGGLYMGHTSRPWLMRMDQLLILTKKYQVPLNIAVIPKYNHPYLDESHNWGEQDPGIMQLKHQAETAFLRGGSLIVHGFDHQNGNAIDDYSGDDWETWDEDAGVFLPLPQQKVITDNAYAEIKKYWKEKPVIWETPHYISNKDTFKAAHASGFRYFTESDTKIFPNWNGYQNNSNGLMLNIPETGAFFQLGTAEVKQKTLVKQLSVLPRIVRMNALFLVFYHNLSSAMHRALDNVLVSSNNYSLWKPNMEQYANFWEQRREVKIDASIDRKQKQIHTLVQNSFEGFTLAIQLPAGKTPVSVTIDDHQTEVKKRKISGAWILYPVLKGGVHDVVVSYQ